jgi:hypothetical protein
LQVAKPCGEPRRGHLQVAKPCGEPLPVLLQLANAPGPAGQSGKKKIGGRVCRKKIAEKEKKVARTLD